MSEWYLSCNELKDIITNLDENFTSKLVVRNCDNHLLEYVYHNKKFYSRSNDGWRIIELEPKHPAWDLINNFMNGDYIGWA